MTRDNMFFWTKYLKLTIKERGGTVYTLLTIKEEMR